MYERTYDIIDWKSCASGSVNGSLIDHDNHYDNEYFPTLFHEDNETETETSIVTIPDYESDYWGTETHERVPDDIEQVSVYQKVANWVSTQKVFFRKEEEITVEDDDLEVIDPVDLFHESVLEDYLLITEDDLERRVILRGLNDNKYDIESVQELLQAHEYKFIREPKGDVEVELEEIIDYGKPKVQESSISKKISTCTTLDTEGWEETILFLGVPRLLENYTILDREGYVIKQDEIPDLWLSPFEENLNKNNGTDEENQSELEFLSSWFSDVYQTDIDTADRQPTLMTDLMEKLTVITVGSDDEVWLDAPEIPHWLDEEHEELELFNQPSRPLYYYRDRIKGCYRIIGVEDETVVLFSGNDDDTIFYTDETLFSPNNVLNNTNELERSTESVKKHMHSNTYPGDGQVSFVSKYRRIYNRLRYGKTKNDYKIYDVKNDSGIDEDMDENGCDDVAIRPLSPIAVEQSSLNGVGNPTERPSFGINPHKESFVECLFVVMSVCVVFFALVLYKHGSSLFQMYRSKFIVETFDYIYAMVARIFE